MGCKFDIYLFWQLNEVFLVAKPIFGHAKRKLHTGIFMYLLNFLAPAQTIINS